MHSEFTWIVDYAITCTCGVYHIWLMRTMPYEASKYIDLSGLQISIHMLPPWSQPEVTPEGPDMSVPCMIILAWPSRGKPYVAHA
jgi:hypothetical protein